MRYVLLCVLMLAGCASTPPQMSLFDEASMYCRDLGYTGPAWSACVERTIARVQSDDEARRAAIGAAILGSGAYRQAPIRVPQPYPIQPIQSQRCYWSNGVRFCQ